MAKKARPQREKGGLRYGEGYVMERTTASGEMRYVARWREPDGRGDATWRGKTFASRDQAEDDLRKIARRKRTGTYVGVSDMTVTDAVNAWIDRRSHEVRESTTVVRRRYLAGTITPSIGDVRISRLTTARVQSWLDALAAEGKAHSTLTYCRNLIGATTAELARLGVIDADPVPPTRAGGRKGKAGTVWTADHVNTILASVADDHESYAWYLLALTTGMRPGELRALRWSAVDLASATVTVAHTVTERANRNDLRIGDTTKTGTTRQVPISPEVIAALRSARVAQHARRLAHPAWHDLDLVFAGRNGGIIPEQTLRNQHYARCEAVGVPTIRLHDLRHTYASIQIEHGINPRAVMDILGHTTLTMTLERYTHTSMASRRDAAAAITAIYSGEDTTTSDAKTGENESMHTSPHTADG